MQYEQVIPGQLPNLEKMILLEVRTMKQVAPTLPITRASLAWRFGKRSATFTTVLNLVGPLLLDLHDVQLTQLGEELADQLADDGRVP